MLLAGRCGKPGEGKKRGEGDDARNLRQPDVTNMIC
jgi:hypothetical protein